MKNVFAKSEKNKAALKVALMVGLGLMLVSTGASADEMGDGICAVVKTLTGKWLFGITLLATASAGAMVLFGSELSDLLKKFATIITVLGLILGMSSILSMAFTAFASNACT